MNQCAVVVTVLVAAVFLVDARVSADSEAADLWR